MGCVCWTVRLPFKVSASARVRKGHSPYSLQIAKTVLLWQWRTLLYFSPVQSCFSLFVFPYILWKSRLHQVCSVVFFFFFFPAAAAAAKSLQSCPSLCDPIDGSPPGSSVPGILQARTLEWVAISFSNAWKWKVKVKSFSRAQLLETPWTGAYQAPPSMGFSTSKFLEANSLLSLVWNFRL